MYALILFAVMMTGDPKDPVVALTRDKVDYYLTKESCELNAKREGMTFLAGLPNDVAMFASKCVEIKGPVGTPA